MPAEGRALTVVALNATLHCLTGCAIGEVLGMAIGTSLGFPEWGTVALAVTLAFLFGYGLTSLPLLRAGLALRAVVPIAPASDTLSIATMEIVDNGLMLAIPGAMEAGLGSMLFWGSLSFALVIAGLVAVPVNRWLIPPGRAHGVHTSFTGRWADLHRLLSMEMQLAPKTKRGKGETCCEAVVHPGIAPEQADRMAALAKAIGDPIRIQLLDVLRRHAGRVCVCELVPLFEVSQPTVSHHLRVLRDAGLISSEKRGLWAYYYVLPGATDELAAWLS